MVRNQSEATSAPYYADSLVSRRFLPGPVVECIWKQVKIFRSETGTPPSLLAATCANLPPVGCGYSLFLTPVKSPATWQCECYEFWEKQSNFGVLSGWEAKYSPRWVCGWAQNRPSDWPIMKRGKSNERKVCSDGCAGAADRRPVAPGLRQC